MKYKHAKPNQFYQGLPAGELDDSTLDAGQQILLDAAIAAGVYVPITDAPARKSKKESPDEPYRADN